MSFVVTLPRNGVSPSYNGSWSVECEVRGSPPNCPGGRMLNARSEAAAEPDAANTAAIRTVTAISQRRMGSLKRGTRGQGP
jgi:hypothetical protein